MPIASSFAMFEGFDLDGADERAFRHFMHRQEAMGTSKLSCPCGASFVYFCKSANPGALPDLGTSIAHAIDCFCGARLMLTGLHPVILAAVAPQ